LLLALHSWNSDIAVIGKSAVRRIRPGNRFGEITHDLPMGKQDLRLRSVGKFERTQQKSPGLKRRDQVL
jgi:hypothetical protein